MKKVPSATHERARCMQKKGTIMCTCKDAIQCRPWATPPPPIVLANRFQIYLPFWLAVFLNFEDTFLGKKAIFVANEKIRWTPKSTFASLVE